MIKMPIISVGQLDFNAVGRKIVMSLAVAFALTLFITQPTQAQTYTVLHAFTGQGDGATPVTNLVIDAAGNVYGTTVAGGDLSCGTSQQGCGVVFRLTQRGTGWTLTPLYTFTGGNDGAFATYLAFGPNGSLYGTTAAGGGVQCNTAFGVGCGTVYNLRPQAHACASVLCPWNETVLYRFTGGMDGAIPNALAFRGGDIYGTAFASGNQGCYSLEGCGTVYDLTPSGSGWNFNLLYSFVGNGHNDAGNPSGYVAFDQSGNFYGASLTGGPEGFCGAAGCGTVFELTPSESGWTEEVIYDFTAEGDSGSAPFGGVTIDNFGNVYGTTGGGNGSAWELSPSGGGWTYTLMSNLCPPDGNCGGSHAPLTMDSAGNFYGTVLQAGANSYGFVFELQPMNGGWTFVDLYDFTGQTDGGYPYGGVTLDSSGNLYGNTYQGGNMRDCGDIGCGVVWEIIRN